MYELLFRSRWYAFAWAVLMAISAIAFTTTGLGAMLTGTAPKSNAGEEAQQARFRSWAADDNRRTGDEQGIDPSSPDQIRDGSARNPPQNTAPFAGTDSDGTDNESSDEGSSDQGKAP